MAIRRIVTASDADAQVLRQTASRVYDFGPDLHRLLDDMLETMRDAPGVGLAAPQLGISRRVIVVEYAEDEDDPEGSTLVYELVNPEIIKSKGAEVAQEGCLSLPGIFADVDRSTYVLVRAHDRYGKEFRLKAYDWLARIVQHEVDHLHGVLMTDCAQRVYRLRQTENGELEEVPLEQPQAT